MDWLEYLQFATEMPFGYAIFFVACMLALIVSVLLFVLGLWRKWWPLSLAGLALALLAVGVVAGNILFDEKLDLNPIVSEQVVAGHWADDDGSSLDLGPDHKASFQFGRRYQGRVSEVAGQGTWKQSGDFDIVLVPAKGPTKHIPPLRMIRFEGAPRLILDDFDDPDGWDHHLGFRKTVK